MDCHTMASMSMRQPPASLGSAHKALIAEAERQGATSYALAKSTGLAINTLQRFLEGRGSPTLATVEAVAQALGLTIDVRKAKR